MELNDIYERQIDRVYRTAMMYLKNSADAEDVVQGVFLRFLEKSPKFANEDHEKAWFIRVTRNFCKDVLKTFWKKNVNLGEVPEPIAAEETQSDLLETVLTLQEKYREVIYLYYYEGYSVKEMSAILRRKESTIQTQLSAARKKLKICLTENGQVSKNGSDS